MKHNFIKCVVCNVSTFESFLLPNFMLIVFASKADLDKVATESDNSPCINVVNVAEQYSRTTQSTTGISAYFLARAQAKSYETSQEEAPCGIIEGIRSYCNFYNAG